MEKSLTSISAKTLVGAATRASNLLKAARQKICFDINYSGLFVGDVHGGHNAPGRHEDMVFCTSKQIAILERFAPAYLAAEFFSLSEFKCDEIPGLPPSNGGGQLEHLIWDDPDDGSKMELDLFLGAIETDVNFRDKLSSLVARALPVFCMTSDENFESQALVARTLLWLGYLNSPTPPACVVGLNCNEPVEESYRMAHSNPVWAESVALDLSHIDSGKKWAVVAGQSHWLKDDACLCNLKNLLPERLEAYSLPAEVFSVGFGDATGFDLTIPRN